MHQGIGAVMPGAEAYVGKVSGPVNSSVMLGLVHRTLVLAIRSMVFTGAGNKTDSGRGNECGHRSPSIAIRSRSDGREIARVASLNHFDARSQPQI